MNASNAPYTTRVLVRRPADPARFSGSVIVEPIHAPSGNDFPLMFAWSADYIFEHHDAYVGITVDPTSIKSLQKFNATRTRRCRLRTRTRQRRARPVAAAISRRRHPTPRKV